MTQSFQLETLLDSKWELGNGLVMVYTTVTDGILKHGVSQYRSHLFCYITSP